ncbi:hypothetical protein EUX98_g3973 [Antrodiella citrinella]|uniref:Enhancer of polycomb-like protein n=1 Tax=Antrodiella citrinella TaxID=2447956 RepID=A0A4S4MXM1_9APHY|nr:hypothetical protein EUX98_g3973 [Antrodiella citrinella]
MPRNHNAGPSTLRNRNRVTNKTRLKVIKESIDADPIVLDEDEEKARVVSTAGVDAEDANEHHLQAVLSAAASRHHQSSRSSGTVPAAFIPTPDSTGIVGNYDDLYPADRWRDPSTYVKTSDTVEEAIADALTAGFVYYMDERDKEWLDKNNEEARGEGTSAQGAVLSTTRSGRNARKGKEPVEGPQPIVMSEDEFELVMAIFEKVTHEKTPFLHHGLEQGSTQFPPFSEYYEAFAIDPHPTLFALASVPAWAPSAPQLSKFAKAVYPHWSKRRQERGGHPIIPIVNLDETDTRNESYICFRRREIKAVRKTRAQQATYGDKMQRLQSEMLSAIDVARYVIQRETMKKDTTGLGLNQADARFKLVDLKRKFPTLGTKEDEELYYDKERVSKKPKLESGRLPLKSRLGNGEYSPMPQEPLMRPGVRRDLIQKQIDDEMASRKTKDHHWEDLVDNPYQQTPTTYSSRLWKAVAESQVNTKTPDSPSRPRLRAARLRFGRGGRMHLDRHMFSPRVAPAPSGSGDEDAHERFRLWQERWKYDDDDSPAVGAKGTDEHDRQLVDDFDLRYASID